MTEKWFLNLLTPDPASDFRLFRFTNKERLIFSGNLQDGNHRKNPGMVLSQ